MPLLSMQQQFKVEPIVKAVQEENLGTVQMLLAQAPQLINQKDPNGTTLLNYAAYFGCLKTCRFLLEQGADPNESNNWGDTPLIQAIVQKHVAIVKALVAHGAEVTLTKADGSWTPLYLAAERGLIDCCRLLIEAGAEVNATMVNGATPLFAAAWFNHATLCKVLFDVGCCINKVDLHNFVINNKLDSVERFLELGADVDSQDDQGITPLWVSAEQGNVPMCALLLQHGAQVNHADKKGVTALHRAALKGHDIVCALLLEHSALLTVNVHQGGTPLHYAAKAGNKELCKHFLNNGAELNAQAGPNKVTPVEVTSDPLTALFLIEQGAVIRQRRKGGPLYYAAETGCVELAEVLINKGVVITASRISDENTPLHLASAEGHLQMVALLLKNGARPTCRNKDGHLPVILALMQGHAEVVVMLIEEHKKIDGQFRLEMILKSSPFALHCAAQYGNVEVCKLLLSLGAKQDCFHGGKTPLMIAAYDGNREICELLIQKLPFLEWYQVQNAAHEAVKQGHLSLVIFLTNKGVDLYSAVDGCNLLECAAQAGQDAIVRCICEQPPFKKRLYGESLYRAARAGHVSTCVSLLDSGIDINSRAGYSQETALHMAATGNQYALCELLLKRGAHVNARGTISKALALHLAAQNGHAEVCELLIAWGSYCDTCNVYNKTPLDCAVGNRNMQVATVIVTQSQWYSFEPTPHEQPTFTQKLRRLFKRQQIEVTPRERIFALLLCLKRVYPQLPKDVINLILDAPDTTPDSLRRDCLTYLISRARRGKSVPAYFFPIIVSVLSDDMFMKLARLIEAAYDQSLPEELQELLCPDSVTQTLKHEVRSRVLNELKRLRKKRQKSFEQKSSQ